MSQQDHTPSKATTLTDFADRGNKQDETPDTNDPSSTTGSDTISSGPLPDPDDLYHPIDEWEEIESETPMGIDGGRRQKLNAAKNKRPLQVIESPFESVAELLTAVREISLARQDSHMCLSIPDVVEKIRSTYINLPEAARPHFVSDDTLLQRVNTARRRFNDWLDAYHRKQKMPGWQEAGPANYDTDKFKKVSDRERSARDEVDDALDAVRAAVNGGARQRALEAIGSSVAEQNAAKRESRIKTRREEFNEGMVVTYRNPREQIGCVYRVNTKSVRVERPNPRHPGTKPLSDEPEPKYLRETIDLDSEHLTRITEDSFTNKYESLQSIDPELPDSYTAALEYLAEEQ